MLDLRDEIRDASLRLAASQRSGRLVERIDSCRDCPEGLSGCGRDLEAELDRRPADGDGWAPLEELWEPG